MASPIHKTGLKRLKKFSLSFECLPRKQWYFLEKLSVVQNCNSAGKGSVNWHGN